MHCASLVYACLDELSGTLTAGVGEEDGFRSVGWAKSGTTTATPLLPENGKDVQGWFALELASASSAYRWSSWMINHQVMIAVRYLWVILEGIDSDY